MPQIKAAKVFDVDVKIAEDRVVRIEMNEDDQIISPVVGEDEDSEV